MRKFILSAVVVVSFLAYAYLKNQNDGASYIPSNNPPASGPTDNSNTAPMMPGNRSMGMTGFRDGIYTGPVTDAFYGNVQVKVTISQGKISNVVFLDYPQDRRTSLEISRQAMPVLEQEAIAVQSADVDIVSGATQTSEAYRLSLASALKQAQ